MTQFISTTTINDECSSNSDCNALYGNGCYCDITDYDENSCPTNTTGMRGLCRKAISDLRTKQSSAPFWLSNREMSGWAGQNFCSVLGKSMVLLSDYGCSDTDSCYTSEKIKAMREAYGNYHTWARSSSGGWYRVEPNGGVCGGNCHSYYTDYVVCK